PPGTLGSMSQAHEVTEQDPYRWLEDVTGSAALDWVRAHNEVTLASLSGGARFASLRAEAREVLDADALAAEEEENWVWQGASVLRQGGYRQALVHLSRGGADASVVREFDIATRGFVEGGFYVPEAKTDVGWIDADRIYVGTDFGPGSLTSSGYPRLVKEWHRGTRLSEAALVYEGKPDDVGVHAFHDPTEGFERDFVVRNIEFYRTELWLRTGSGDLVQVPVPEDAIADVHREWLLIQTRSPWAVGGA